jgi:hypothetical protein
MTLKFSIAGRIYDAVDTQNLSMLDMLLFEQQTAEFGRPLTWAEVTTWHRELAELPTDAAREQHPAVLLVTAVSIWAARRAAGEKVTFSEAVDFPLSDMRIIPDPTDHAKPAGKAQKPRKAGGAAVKSPEAEATDSVEP